MVAWARAEPKHFEIAHLSKRRSQMQRHVPWLSGPCRRMQMRFVVQCTDSAYRANVGRLFASPLSRGCTPQTQGRGGRHPNLQRTRFFCNVATSKCCTGCLVGVRQQTASKPQATKGNDVLSGEALWNCGCVHTPLSRRLFSKGGSGGSGLDERRRVAAEPAARKLACQRGGVVATATRAMGMHTR